MITVDLAWLLSHWYVPGLLVYKFYTIINIMSL